MRKQIIEIYKYILILGGLYALWCLTTGIYIPCFYYSTLGYLCGGCGITRMFISMIKLDFVTAFYYNPVCFILFFVWNGIALMCFTEKIKFVQSEKFLYTILTISLSILVIYAIIRNII